MKVKCKLLFNYLMSVLEGLCFVGCFDYNGAMKVKKFKWGRKNSVSSEWPKCVNVWLLSSSLSPDIVLTLLFSLRCRFASIYFKCPSVFLKLKELWKLIFLWDLLLKKKKGYNVHLIMILSVLKTHNNSPCSLLLNTVKEQLKAGH